VRRDADGLLYFVGRADGMIKTAGNRVSPTEVEEAAIASGLVAEAVALGTPDPRLGQAIALVARPTRGPEEEQLRAHLKRMLPNFMQPAAILWRKELPRSPNGKIDRNALEAELTA
jgi:acyl-coenzyme A synthetase/AMP-(fatty) acid ligase